MDISNVDELVNEYVPKTPARNKNPLAPQWPARVIIVAPSGGGKTTILVNLVTKYLEFDRIYIYVKDLSEDKYQFMIGYIEALQRKYNEENDTDKQFIWYSDRAEDIIKVNDLDPEYQNLVIIDDAVLDKTANSAAAELFIRGRKRNATIIYQTQSFFSMPKTIRLNANYLILMSAGSASEMRELAKTYATDLTYDEFKKLYRECTNTAYGFMVIDKVTNKPPMKYRCKFDGLYVPTPHVSDADTGEVLRGYN